MSVGPSRHLVTMKVLIIDGFAKSSKGRLQFKQFHSATTQGFSKSCDGEDPTFVVRSHLNLRDYIFESDSEYMDASSHRNFDSIDFIFMDGDANFRPWSRQARQLTILFKMAIMTRKCCFLAAAGMQTLVHIFTTAGVKLNVINSQGGRVADLYSTPPVVRDRFSVAKQPLPVFLDKKTGDLFCYRPEKATWNSCSNVGMRLERAAARKKVYRPQHSVHKEVDGPYMGQPTAETVCAINVKHIQHFAFRNLRTNRFVVAQQNKWVVNGELNALSFASYTVLADNTREPQVIEFENILAVQPNVLSASKYPEVNTILQNFLRHYYMLMRHVEHLDERITAASWESFVDLTIRRGGRRGDGSGGFGGGCSSSSSGGWEQSKSQLSSSGGSSVGGGLTSGRKTVRGARRAASTSGKVRARPATATARSPSSNTRVPGGSGRKTLSRPQSALARPTSRGGHKSSSATSSAVAGRASASRMMSSRRPRSGKTSRPSSGSSCSSQQRRLSSSGTKSRPESAADKEAKRIALQERRRLMGDSYIMAPASVPKIVAAGVPTAAASPSRGGGLSAVNRLRASSASRVRPPRPFTPEFGDTSPSRPSQSAHPRSRSPYSSVGTRGPKWAQPTPLVRSFHRRGTRHRERKRDSSEDEDFSQAVSAAGLIDPGPLSSARPRSSKSGFCTSDSHAGSRMSRSHTDRRLLDSSGGSIRPGAVSRLSQLSRGGVSSTSGNRGGNKGKINVSVRVAAAASLAKKNKKPAKQQQWEQKVNSDRSKRATKVKIIRQKKKVPFSNFKKHDRRRRKDALIPGYHNGCVVTASGPYIDAYEEARMKERDSKQQWVGSRNFTAVIGKATISEPAGARAGIVRASGPYLTGGVKFRDFKRKADAYGRRGWQ